MEVRPVNSPIPSQGARSGAPRTLLITTVAPYPKNVGKRVVLGGFCDYFMKRRPAGDFRVLSFEHLPAHLNASSYPQLKKPNVVRKLWNAFWHTALWRRKSLQEAFFWSPAACQQIDTVIDDFQSTLVIFDTLRVGQYRESLRATYRAVLYLDDLFSVRYERLLQTMDKFPGVPIDATGNFAKNIPKFLMSIYRATPGLQRLLLVCERHLVARSEDRQPRQFDLALLINAEEAKRLNKRAQISHVQAISPFIESDKVMPPRTWNGEPTFVFLGSLNLPHNGFSIERFVTTHLPRLVEEIHGFKLLVIGRHASPRLQELAQEHLEHLQLQGYVDKIDPVLSSCAGMIAPLLFGSGVKIKIIDALRMGVPIVATRFGSEGITADGAQGLIIEDDIGRFAKHCRRLLNPLVNAEHSRASQQLFERNYSSDSVNRQYDEYFQRGAVEPSRPFRPSATSPRPL
jgi:glycosyltransferase involved in cell wall biosynthesis